MVNGVMFDSTYHTLKSLHGVCMVSTATSSSVTLLFPGFLRWGEGRGRAWEQGLALGSYVLKKTINEFRCHEAKWSKVKRPGVEPRTPLD